MDKKSELVSLSDEDAVKEILIETVQGLWGVVNNLTRLRPTKHERYRVTIFGSARAKPDTFAYQQVKQVAKVLSGMGCDIITGGGPGLMQAANEGAAESHAGQRIRSVGIRVDLPFEQDVNPFVTEAFEHGTFFTRLHHFVLASDAFVVVPGGIGTLLEACMVWQLLQVRKIQDVPLIFAGKMWPDLIVWARKYLLSGEVQLVNPEDLEIPICVNNADEVIAVISKYHESWLAVNKVNQK